MNPKVHILVVDDDENLRNVLCMMLAHLGYATTAAKDAIEALRCMADDNDFHFVLTDIHMPQIDGWELALRIKALNPCMPIAAITGDAPDSILPHLEGSAISHVLYKPLKMDFLGKAVSDILESEMAECAG